MPTFRYLAIDRNGFRLSETMVATTRSEIIEALKLRDLFIVRLEEVSPLQDNRPLFFRLPLAAKVEFTKHLATMIDAGLPISQALGILYKDTNNLVLRKIIETLSFVIESGKPLSEGLRQFPSIFEPIFIAMVKAGETSGNLGKVLFRLHTKLKRDAQLLTRVKLAFIYPSIVVSTLIFVGGVLLFFVIPRLVTVFERLNVPLPLPTKILLWVSKILNANLILSLITLVAVIVGLVLFLRTQNGKKLILWLSVHLPIIREIDTALDLTRFTTTLAFLLESGVSIQESLRMTAEIVVQSKKRLVVMRAVELVGKGETLASALEEGGQAFPQLVTSLIRVGENTGKLSGLLSDIGDFYEAELDDKIRVFTTILEPILTIVIGFGIGGVVVAVLLPIYQLVGRVGGQ